MLHLINAGAAQQLAVSMDEHDLWIVSADGAFVTPQKVQVSAPSISDHLPT
jgi:FtsP/CotA-like multicopper oxidase with cupredoxin domain